MTAQKRPLDADTLWQLSRIGGLALSPDGTRAVCSVTQHDMNRNTGSTALWLLETAGGEPRRLTRCGEKDGQAAWSPKGDRIAFIGRRDQEGRKDTSAQLYVIPADGGEATRISDFAPGVLAFKWMPDGRRIVFTAWVWPRLKGAAAQNKQHKAWRERKETGYATSEAFYRYWDHNIPQDRVQHLLMLDVATGTITDLFEGTPHELERSNETSLGFDVHPDGRRIVFTHDPSPVQRLGNRSVLTELTLRGRRFDTLAAQKGWDFAAPRYSPDGRTIAMLAAHVAQAHTATAELMLLDRASRRWQRAGADWDLNLNAPLRWSPDSRAVYFTAEERGRTPLWRHTVGGLGFERVHPGGTVPGFDVAGDVVVFAEDTATHPAQVFALREGDEPVRLERFNDDVLQNVALGELREVEVAGALGEPVQMWLTFPPGFDAKRRHAVTHVIHGGPFAAAGDTWGWRWNPHVFAAAGHVIAQVNFHGSSGFGWAFRHSLIGRQGELELQDIEAGTEWLLQQRWTDPKRLFATGGSYGGFLVAWMNGHVSPGRYRAYVCHAGVFDRVATFSADSYPMRPKDLAANFWSDMDRVHAQSPHASAGRMETPTLVIHGAKDYRVPDCNGLAYYNTLKARGVDARLLWFPDENHWVLKPCNSRLWYAEFAAWLARFDKPVAGQKPPRRRAAQVSKPRG